MKSLKGILFIGLSMLLTILAWLSSGASQFLIPWFSSHYTLTDFYTS